MSDIVESATSILESPLMFEPFSPAIGRIESSVTPPESLRDINKQFAYLLDATLFLNRSSMVKERQIIPAPGWIIRFGAEALIVSRRQNCDIGEPYISLSTTYPADRLSADQKWNLFINGPVPIKIGEASTHNEAHLESLLSAANDPEALMNMAAVINPEHLAKLTERLKAKSMAEETTFPRMDAKTVKQLLINAGLNHPNLDATHGHRAGPVNLKTGKKSTTVAIAVKGCEKTQIRPFTRSEESRSYSEQTRLKNELVQAAQEEWPARVRPVMVEAGWRELPRAYSWSPTYFTLADEETWKSLGKDNTKYLSATLTKSSMF